MPYVLRMVSPREIEPHDGALRSFFLATQKRRFLSIFGQTKETGSHRTETPAMSHARETESDDKFPSLVFISGPLLTELVRNMSA